MKSSAGLIAGTGKPNAEDRMVPCFTPGTMIATPKGERPVEDIRPGDRILTRDNGIQEVVWNGQKSVSKSLMSLAQELRPIRIQAGALGENLPERDMLVSPQHRLLIVSNMAKSLFDETEVFVAAKHMTRAKGIDVTVLPEVNYLHFMFEKHEVVLANGTWTESFQVNDYTLKAVGQAQRDELIKLFPDLVSKEPGKGTPAARRTLRVRETFDLL